MKTKRIPTTRKELKDILTGKSYAKILELANSPSNRIEGEEANKFLLRVALRRQASRMLKEGYCTFSEISKVEEDPIMGYNLKEDGKEWVQVDKETYILAQRDLFGKRAENKLFKSFGGRGIQGYIVQLSNMDKKTRREMEIRSLQADIKNQFYPGT